MNELESFFHKQFKEVDNNFPLNKKVYIVLRDSIIKQKLKPNDVVTEESIARLSGLSRTPVREGVSLLEKEGFVNRVSGKGIVITGFSKEDLEEITLIISVLEGLAARCAAEASQTEEKIRYLQNMEMVLEETEFHIAKNPDISLEMLKDKNVYYHTLILKMSNNKHLASNIKELHKQIKRARLDAMALPHRRNKAISEHREIFEAINSGENLKAEELMRQHLLGWREALIRTWKY